MSYTHAPILTYKMDDLALLYQERMERDSCGLVGMVEYSMGKRVNVYINGTGKCTAKISRVTSESGADPNQFWDSGNEEKYGRDITRDVPIVGM